MSDLFWMPLNIEKHLSNPMIQALSAEEELAYLRLQMYLWRSKDCTLPNDDKALRRLGKLQDRAPLAAVRSLFNVEGDKLFDPELKAVRIKKGERAAANKRRAQLASAERWNKRALPANGRDLQDDQDEVHRGMHDGMHRAMPAELQDGSVASPDRDREIEGDQEQDSSPIRGREAEARELTDTNGHLPAFRSDRIGDLKRCPKKPCVQGSQGFHNLEDWQIITWIVWQEPPMKNPEGRVRNFKRLGLQWIRTLNPLWTTEAGRVAVYDWLAHIWNSQNASDEKAVGSMDNPAAWLNGEVTKYKNAMGM